MDQMEAMKDRIREEIHAISSLEEKVIFKDLMEGVFLSLYETNEQRYLQLEKRVMEDLAYDSNRYLIRTGLVEKAYWDSSHHLMVPMLEEDTVSQELTWSKIQSQLMEKKSFCIRKFLLQCDSLLIQQLLQRKEPFQARIYGDHQYEIPVTLELNREYLSKIEHLYHLFIKNGIPWQTINSPYLYKIVNAVIHEIPAGVAASERIHDIQIDLGEQQEYACYDLIPVWNISRLELDSVGFPIPCEDHKNFEHTISLREYGPQNSYLLDDGIDMQSIRQAGDNLYVTGEAEAARRWKIHMIRNGIDRKIDRYTYPIMENQRQDTFVERFQKQCQQRVKTQAELTRFIRSFGLESYLQYYDYRIAEDWEGDLETYSMNYFIPDEIRERRKQEKFILYFRSQGKLHWLLRDLASFIVSEVQAIFPDYHCGGKVV